MVAAPEPLSQPGYSPPPGRRLTQAEVKDFIEHKGARLHAAYTEAFFEYHGTACMNNDLVYELPNGDVIYILYPNGLINPGEGYYYTRDVFMRILEARQRK